MNSWSKVWSYIRGSKKKVDGVMALDNYREPADSVAV
jgi:hypothetical protein